MKPLKKIAWAAIACSQAAFSVSAFGRIYSPDIIGGRAVGEKESPWQVALINVNGVDLLDGLRCGGTLIQPDVVLTAAHCFYNKDCEVDKALQLYIAYGSTKLGKRINLVAAPNPYIHDHYDCKSHRNDIALLVLPERLPGVKAIALPKVVDLALPGQRLFATGWGLTKVGGWKSVDLQEVDVPVVNLEVCKQRYPNALFAKALCAGEAGKDSCTGDSGGPLYRRVAGSTDAAVQIGVVSFGDKCGVANSPGVYTAVFDHIEWIKSKLPKPAACKPPMC